MIAVFLSLLGLLAAGAAYQALGTIYDRRRHRLPGQMVDVGGFRLHVRVEGTGEPVVVLESGLAATSLSWPFVQPEVAKFTTAISYDRAGLGWSDAPRTPRSVSAMVSELRLVLQRIGFRGPFVLVGHSFGGLLIRAYAAMCPEEIAGLVFVDPVSLEYWASCSANERRRLALGVKLSRRGAFLARWGVVRLALSLAASGGKRIPKLIGRTAATGRGNAFMERMVGEVRKLPKDAVPVVRAHWSRAQSFETMAATLTALPQNAETVLAMPIPAGVPFVILSAASASEQELAERDNCVRQSGGHGRHVRLAECGHWLPLDRPDEVVAAVRKLVDVVREISDGGIG